MSGICVWSMIELGSRMECHASKNNLRDHKRQRSMTLTLLKSNSWLFFIQCCAKREFLSHVRTALLCSFVLDLNALECLTDTLELQLESLVLDTQRLVLQLVLVLASEPE